VCGEKVLFVLLAEIADDITNTLGHECLHTESGEGYIGHLNYTVSRIPCQRWGSQWPHEHGYDDITFFPDYATNPNAIIQDVNNYCRNPSVVSFSDFRPWCFTRVDEIEYEYCDIPKCKRKCTIHDTLEKW